jgi:protein-S-isoprenylcysteine O-methyltransferase Ste14
LFLLYTVSQPSPFHIIFLLKMGYMTSIGFYVPDWTGLTITSFIIGTLLSLSAVATMGGETTPYSKFGNRPKLDTISSRRAMLIIYLPSIIVSILIQRPSFQFKTQFDIVHLLVMIHFVKRVFEVLFVHIYRSKTNAETMLAVMGAYTTTTLLDLLVVRRIPENIFSSKVTKCGIAFVIFGEIINAYHHMLLRNMRLSSNTNKKRGYSLPKGGWFEYVVAPHYLAEQLVFLGFIMLSQNIVTLVLKLFPFIYLSIRASKTHEWYNVNLTDKSDKDKLLKRKNLIPFIW